MSQRYICQDSGSIALSGRTHELVEEAWDFPGHNGFLRREKPVFMFLVMSAAVWQVK